MLATKAMREREGKLFNFKIVISDSGSTAWSMQGIAGNTAQPAIHGHARGKHSGGGIAYCRAVSLGTPTTVNFLYIYIYI